MFSSSKPNLSQLYLYQKALEIFKLSRQVAAYITDDKDVISMYRSGKKTDNYADNLVMNAFRLAPKIAETEVQDNPHVKLKHARSLRYFIDRLYQDCLKLERSKINGSDFVRMLRRELRLFKKAHKLYVSSLL